MLRAVGRVRGTGRSRAVSRVWGAGRTRGFAPSPSDRTAPAPPSGSVPGAAWQRLRPQLAGSVPGGPTSPCLHLLSLPEARRAARGGRAGAGARLTGRCCVVGSCPFPQRPVRSCLCCLGVVVLCSWRGIGWVGAGCSIPSPREKLGQGGIWGRGLGTDWRGRRL